MNKKIKRTLSLSLLALSLVSVSASARSIGTLTKFMLPRWQGVVSTESRTKSISDAPWVLNINNLDNTSCVDAYLSNSDDNRRSDYSKVGQGRHEINSWGKSGYKYKGTIMNSSSSFSNAYLTGSWSPDNR